MKYIYIYISTIELYSSIEPCSLRCLWVEYLGICMEINNTTLNCDLFQLTHIISRDRKVSYYTWKCVLRHVFLRHMFLRHVFIRHMLIRRVFLRHVVLRNVVLSQ